MDCNERTRKCDFCGIDTLYVTIITLLLPDEAPGSDFAGLPPAVPLLLGPISEHFSAMVKDSSKIFTLQHQKNTTDVENCFHTGFFCFHLFSQRIKCNTTKNSASSIWLKHSFSESQVILTRRCRSNVLLLIAPGRKRRFPKLKLKLLLPDAQLFRI